VALTVLGERGHEAASAPSIVEYVKSLMRGVSLEVGLLMGLTIRGIPFILEVQYQLVFSHINLDDYFSFRFQP
jgi:hypothetical protein